MGHDNVSEGERGAAGVLIRAACDAVTMYLLRPSRHPYPKAYPDRKKGRIGHWLGRIGHDARDPLLARIHFAADQPARGRTQAVRKARLSGLFDPPVSGS